MNVCIIGVILFILKTDENEDENTKEIIPSLKNCSELNNLDSSKLPDSPSGPPPDENDKLLEEINTAFGPFSNDSSLAGSIDSGAIAPCLYKFVYIFPSTGKSFWTYLTYVGKKSIAGYKWTGHRWVYFGMPLMKIDSFICY